MQQQNDDASAMLRGMLNIGGSAPAAPAPSAQQLAAQQLAAAQQQLAELEAKHGKIQEAFAQMHTVPPEQQPGVQQQLLALRQQVVQQHQQQQQVVAQMQMKMMQVMAAPPQQMAPLAGLVTATAPVLPGMAAPVLPGFAPPGAPPAAAPPGPPGLPPGLGMGAPPPPQPAAAAPLPVPPPAQPVAAPPPQPGAPTMAQMQAAHAQLTGQYRQVEQALQKPDLSPQDREMLIRAGKDIFGKLQQLQAMAAAAQALGPAAPPAAPAAPAGVIASAGAAPTYPSLAEAATMPAPPPQAPRAPAAPPPPYDAQLLEQREIAKGAARRVRAEPIREPYQRALEADTRRVLGELQPEEGDAGVRADLLARLQAMVTGVSSRAILRKFGSSVSGLHSKGADLDLTLVIEGAELKDMELELQRTVIKELAQVFEESGQLSEVHARPMARVPVIAMGDKASGLKCDICMCNRLALLNSRMIKCYVDFDPRVKELCFLVKYWAKRRSINEPYKGTPSSYAWVLCVIHFLQLRQPPVVPCLQTLRGGAWNDAPDEMVVTTKDMKQFDCSYCADVDAVRAAMASLPQPNKEPLGRLLIQFFHHYSRVFDFVKGVASVRCGRFLTKEQKRWTKKDPGLRGDRHLFCIEDPFETTHDLGRVMDRDTVRDVREEIDRAYKMLSQEKRWDEVCEKYEAPAPPPAPAKKEGDAAAPQAQRTDGRGADAALAGLPLKADPGIGGGPAVLATAGAAPAPPAAPVAPPPPAPPGVSATPWDLFGEGKSAEDEIAKMLGEVGLGALPPLDGDASRSTA